jgi:hypothetical protein
MMASPSATAAYLMKCEEWDDSAEAYLRLAVECGEGRGTGAVPSAWPSTNFELLWVSLHPSLHGIMALKVYRFSRPCLNLTF